ncbi:MAG: hypothetical protein JNL87_02205 [Burkholderiaceae bacterium]|nr:hypothetical protein [Burkholderiaceae bacterium]
MSSNTQILTSAYAPAGGSAARALVAPLNGIGMLLRSAIAASTRRLRALRLAAQANELRERGQAYLATHPGYAAELLGAADLLDAAADRA